MGDIDIKLSFTSTESKDNNVSTQNQPIYSTTLSQQLNESENLGTSHCTMTNTMPTTTTTILTNAHPSAVTEDSISSPSTSSSLAMTPTSTTTVIAATFADCVSASSTTTNAQQLTQHPQSTDDSISGLTTSTTSVLLNGTNSFNNSNINNNTIDTLDIKLAASTESSKSPDLCLSSSSSSINGAVAPPSILIPPNTSCGYSSNPEQGSGGAMWSNIDDGSHMSLNGYNNYQNYTSSPMFNGASPNSIAAAISQHNRRAITASHGSGGYQHGPHGLSPNSMNRSNSMIQTQQQSQQSQPKQVGFNNNYPTWSNPPPWPGQQQQQQNMQSWNRGRSVPNLNPMTNVLPNRKPTSPNPSGLSPSAYSAQQNAAISPSKYRRSTSFPGKVQGGYPGPMDVQGGIDDGREAFMQYQERNGMGNGLDMRSLEHCLSDLMRGCGDGAGPPDHLKAEDTQKLRAHARAFLEGVQLPYDVPKEDLNACDFLKNATCPLQKGVIVHYELIAPVDAPVTGPTVDMEFELIGDNDKVVFCLRFNPKETGDWIWDWSSRPDQLPPKGWNFEHPRRPIGYSMRLARVGKNSLFSREVLYSLLITNVLSLLLGAGFGLWLSKRNGGVLLRLTLN